MLQPDLHLNCPELLHLGRWHFRHCDCEHPIPVSSRDIFVVRILMQLELLKELAEPPLHPDVLDVLLLGLLPPPLRTHDQQVPILHLDLDLALMRK